MIKLKNKIKNVIFKKSEVTENTYYTCSICRRSYNTEVDAIKCVHNHHEMIDNIENIELSWIDDEGYPNVINIYFKNGKVVRLQKPFIEQLW